MRRLRLTIGGTGLLQTGGAPTVSGGTFSGDST
jgi:hypothetical protein